MNCDICGGILNYIGGDCYCCPTHGFNYLLAPMQYIEKEYGLTDIEARSLFESNN